MEEWYMKLGELECKNCGAALTVEEGSGELARVVQGVEEEGARVCGWPLEAGKGKETL